MKVSKLYGILDTETNLLIPMYTSKGNRYAYTQQSRCYSHLLTENPKRYIIVELVPNYKKDEV